MIHITALTKRNIKLFLRDRATVFFSLLSTLILVGLYLLFIAKTYSDALLGEMGGLLSESGSNFLIYLQMIAGVMILNSMSLSTGAFGTIAKDFENRRVDSFLLTPARVHEILISYFAAGFLISFILNLFSWIISFLLIGFLTTYWISLKVFILTAGSLFAASFISAALMLLITSLVKSSAAIGVISGVAGTFVGFLSGIYMPYSSLGEATKKVGSLLPFSHLTVWIKNILLSDASAQLNITGELKEIVIDGYFSAGNIGFLGLDIPLWILLLASGVFALLCLVASSRILKKRMTA
ncbi:MAG TPA: ABC transporter permease [Oscillospiraceae bacterium]|nr:ABC transporter permease [Oscillospiraceae bacterium]